jgi:hypothetical protein
MGTSGEYSDRDEWTIKAYRSEERAQNHVNKANEFARSWRVENQYDFERDYAGWNPHDPENRSPNHEPDYFLQSVEYDGRASAGHRAQNRRGKDEESQQLTR